MKWFFTFAIVLVCIQGISQTGDTATMNNYSKIFNRYSSSFENLVVCFVSGSMLIENGRRFIIIGINGSKGSSIDYYLNRDKEDSVSVSPLPSPKKTLKFFSKTLHKLQSEEQIVQPCIKKTDITKKNDTFLVEIEDLRLGDDYLNTVIEYKVKGVRRRVEQVSPTLAMKICPNNIERKFFLDFITIISKYSNNPLKM